MYFEILTPLDVVSSGGLAFVALGLGVSGEIAVPAHDGSSTGRLISLVSIRLISSSVSTSSASWWISSLIQSVS